MGYYAKLSALWGLSCRNVQQGAAGGGQYSPEPPACWRCRSVPGLPHGNTGRQGRKKSRQARINACARLVNVVAYSRGRACRAAAFFAGLTPRRIVSLGGAFLV